MAAITDGSVVSSSLSRLLSAGMMSVRSFTFRRLASSARMLVEAAYTFLLGRVGTGGDWGVGVQGVGVLAYRKEWVHWLSG